MMQTLPDLAAALVNLIHECKKLDDIGIKYRRIAVWLVSFSPRSKRKLATLINFDG